MLFFGNQQFPGSVPPPKPPQNTDERVDEYLNRLLITTIYDKRQQHYALDDFIYLQTLRDTMGQMVKQILLDAHFAKDSFTFEKVSETLLSKLIVKYPNLQNSVGARTLSNFSLSNHPHSGELILALFDNAFTSGDVFGHIREKDFLSLQQPPQQHSEEPPIHHSEIRKKRGVTHSVAKWLFKNPRVDQFWAIMEKYGLKKEFYVLKSENLMPRAVSIPNDMDNYKRLDLWKELLKNNFLDKKVMGLDEHKFQGMDKDFWTLRDPKQEWIDGKHTEQQNDEEKDTWDNAFDYISLPQRVGEETFRKRRSLNKRKIPKSYEEE